MSAVTREELWARLTAAVLTSGELPAVAVEWSSPWPVRVMLGIAGWIGALFLLFFAGVAFGRLFDRPEAALPAGAACCAAAYGVFRLLPRNDFAAQFGFAISLAGQALIMAGLAKLAGVHLSSGIFLAMAAVEAVLAVAIPSYIHRVFTTVAANFCLFLAAVVLGVPALATGVAAAGFAVIWLDRVRLAKRPQFWEPIGYGFGIALLSVDGSPLFGSDVWNALLRPGEHAPFFLWAGPALSGLALVYVAWRLRDRAGSGLIALALAAAIFGVAAPGIGAAILVLAVGFDQRSRVLMGLGVLAFGGYLSHFYYQLNFTLLAKSMALAATGCVLLALRLTMGRWFPVKETIDA
jgi:hypothetical protein